MRQYIIDFIQTICISVFGLAIVASYKLYNRKKSIRSREKYLSTHYKSDNEIEFVCTDFDFFDHDEKYEQELMYVTLSDTQIRYDFTISIDENLKKGHFKKIDDFINEFYPDKIDTASLIQSILIQEPPSTGENLIQYGIQSLSRGRIDFEGRPEASSLYITLCEIDKKTAWLIDNIYKRLREQDENVLRLKSRELKFKVSQLNSILDLEKLLIFMTTIQISGFIAWKKSDKGTVKLIFQQKEDKELFYAYDFPLYAHKNNILLPMNGNNASLDYTRLIQQEILNHYSQPTQKQKYDIVITDICLDYTHGFHLKLLSYAGYTGEKEIKSHKNSIALNIEYTELRNHLTYKCKNKEIALYALSLSQKARHNIEESKYTHRYQEFPYYNFLV